MSALKIPNLQHELERPELRDPKRCRHQAVESSSSHLTKGEICHSFGYPVPITSTQGNYNRAKLDVCKMRKVSVIEPVSFQKSFWHGTKHSSPSNYSPSSTDGDSDNSSDDPRFNDVYGPFQIQKRVEIVVQRWGAIASIPPDKFLIRILSSRGYSTDMIPALQSEFRRYCESLKCISSAMLLKSTHIN